MAHASRKEFGAGQQDQGKGDASGGMTPDMAEGLPENEVLSNRDTARRWRQRGLDSRHVQNQQHHDHAGNRERTAEEEDLPDRRPGDEPIRAEP
ncbi:hypothetical protein O4J55_05295 [Paracoccus sp. PXZ]|uniref:hypothetical protein n=1 Tax=Paracoccus sp. MKU1 TaxID=1745182 RepID=UPI0007F02BB5|nr:hypothetical protein [Paracoccus sp. MKU1]